MVNEIGDEDLRDFLIDFRGNIEEYLFTLRRQRFDSSMAYINLNKQTGQNSM